eukprot:3364052-Pyramimonas_sp.AAC.1
MNASIGGLHGRGGMSTAEGRSIVSRDGWQWISSGTTSSISHMSDASDTTPLSPPLAASTRMASN